MIGLFIFSSKWYRIKSEYKKAKEMFLKRERVIPKVQDPSVRKEESDLEVTSSSGNSLSSGKTEELPFIILN